MAAETAGMAAGAEPPARVEKLMSCTRAEFELGLARLTGAAPRRGAEGAYDLSAAAGGRPVLCTFEEQSSVVLGGLLALPRVRVTLRLEALAGHERAGFLQRFDRTFQRGGG